MSADLTSQQIFFHNRKIYYLDTVLITVANVSTGTYLTKFAIDRFHATDAIVGLYVSLTSLVVVLFGMSNARLVERYRPRMRLIVISLVVSRLFIIPIGCIPLFIHFHPALIWLSLSILQTIFSNVVSLATVGLFIDVVPLDKRVNLISTASILTICTSLVALPITGRLADQIAFPYSYYLLFGIGFLFATASTLVYSRLIDPKLSTPTASSPPQTSGSFFLEFYQILAKNEEFRIFCLSLSVFYFGIYLPSALFSIYYIKVLKAANSALANISAVSQVATLIANPFWAKQSNLKGDRKILIATCFGLSFVPAMVGFCPSINYVILVTFYAGIFVAGMSLTATTTLYRLVPEEQRSSYLAVNSILVNLMASIAPISGTLLREGGIFSFVTLFFLSTCIRLVGVFLLYYLPKRSQPDS